MREMNNEYIEQALRTNSHAVGRQVRNSLDFAHACLGLVTEYHELGNAKDETNRREEQGDMCWYVALACHALDIDWPDFKLKATRPLDDLVFELADMGKKWFAYGKRPTTAYVEAYLTMILAHIDDVPDAQRRNIRKLRARYPDKFAPELAIVRDLDAEREALRNE